MRISYYRQDNDSEPEVVSIREAKKLLKNGGTAWTEHYKRDGTLFKTTEIRLTGNNSSYKYNRHL